MDYVVRKVVCLQKNAGESTNKNVTSPHCISVRLYAIGGLLVLSFRVKKLTFASPVSLKYLVKKSLLLFFVLVFVPVVSAVAN